MGLKLASEELMITSFYLKRYLTSTKSIRNKFNNYAIFCCILLIGFINFEQRVRIFVNSG